MALNSNAVMGTMTLSNFLLFVEYLGLPYVLECSRQVLTLFQIWENPDQRWILNISALYIFPGNEYNEIPKWNEK